MLNVGQKSEIVMILNHLFGFSYSIAINEQIDKYKNEPIFLSEGNINEPQKKKRLDEVLFRTYIEDKYGKIDLKEFNEILKEENNRNEICSIMGIHDGGNNSKADFYIGDLALSAKSQAGKTPSIFNRGIHENLLLMCDRMEYNEIIRSKYDNNVLKDYSLKIDKLLKEFMTHMSDKTGTREKMYNKKTKEYGFFHSKEKWDIIAPLIYYTGFIGTRTQDSFNTANCMLEAYDQYEPNTYVYDFDGVEWIEKNKNFFEFELRSASSDEIKLSEDLLKLSNEELIPMGYYKHYDNKNKIWKIGGELVIKKNKSM